MNKMSPKSSIDQDFAKFFARAGKAMGMPDSMSKVVGMMYLEPSEISLDELAKKTGYSLASVSNIMRMMEEAGLVVRSRKPGTKKVYFYLEKDLMRINKQKLFIAHEYGIKPAKEYLPTLIAKYDDKKVDDDTKEKVKILKSYYTQLLEFEKVLEHMKEDLDRISSGLAANPIR